MKLFRTMTLLILLGGTIAVLAQGRPYQGPDDPAGDIAAERDAFMNGNRILLYFRNTTELSDWPRPDVSRWPNDFRGTKALDGVGLMIGARVYLENDSIPVTDPQEIATRTDLDTLFFLQTSYRENMDSDPTGTVEWGIYPVFGYFNENSETPAMSNRANSWPRSGWPAPNYTTKWPGEWNGRFGRGVQFADLESFLVANDAQDIEYLGENDQIKYYPRPGKFIGDLNSEVTIQKGQPWGGLGLRIEQRGFQWNNPQARDAIFWEYNIANISDYDITEAALGYWVDNQIGNDNDDEIGFFDVQVDMAYSWDIDGVGFGGLQTGVMGFAFLESPGKGFDGADNDNDGIVDEQRDNEATSIVGPYDGIDDLQKFLSWYNLTEEDLRDHWDADEDQDWQDGIDANGNGVYDIDEFAGDDVGLDGVGPTDLNYDGPDADGTEGNHRPDFVEGIGSEPNFALTDISESDMVGLTAFRMFPSESRGDFTFDKDKPMWDLIGVGFLEEWTGQVANLIETFGSGPFPLFKGRTERISMSVLHSYDALSGLNSPQHLAPALFEQKAIVQVIYESDYRFAQPPELPTLKAVPGDGFVVLSWDDAADKLTREPLLKNTNDFQGYKLFRATDKKLADAEIITDGFGTPLLKKPIFECDLVDSISGFANYGQINGQGYYLGSNSGIRHHYVDREVQNGRTYYYALVAYDYGLPNLTPGVAPSENNIVIDLDEDEQVRFFNKNVQIVTPHQYAAGYVQPDIANLADSTFGSVTVEPEIFVTDELKDGHTYRVTFGVDTTHVKTNMYYGIVYRNNSINVYDVTDGERLIYREDETDFSNQNFLFDLESETWYMNEGNLQTELIDGVRLNIEIPKQVAELDTVNSRWLTESNAPIDIIQPDPISLRHFPYDYDIIFTDDDSAFVGRIPSGTIKDEFDQAIPTAERLLNRAFNFYVVNRSINDTTGLNDSLELVVHDLNGSGEYEPLEDRVLVGFRATRSGIFQGRWNGLAFVIDFRSAGSLSALPESGDIYRVTFQRPALETDKVSYTINVTEDLDRTALKVNLDQVKVVPNPYVATNKMEEAISNPFLNQQRKLMFTNVPARCTIKIFTVSGILVDVIEVNNPDERGIVHWDMLTREGLEIAAGMYLFHLKADATGDELLGKFAVIK